MYIVVEGLDGGGKSTLARELATQMNAHYTWEPYSGVDLPECQKIREMCLAKDSNLTTMAREYMLIASRSISYNHNVLRWLEQDDHVVSDRSFISGMAYAMSHGVSPQDWKIWFNTALPHYFYPDVIVYVKNDEYAIKKADDLYDDRDKNFRNQMERNFEMAMSLFDVRVVTFQNSFKKTPEENAKILLEKINEKM